MGIKAPVIKALILHNRNGPEMEVRGAIFPCVISSTVSPGPVSLCHFCHAISSAAAVPGFGCIFSAI
jgi:hypothetical protein